MTSNTNLSELASNSSNGVLLDTHFLPHPRPHRKVRKLSPQPIPTASFEQQNPELFVRRSSDVETNIYTTIDGEEFNEYAGYAVIDDGDVTYNPSTTINSHPRSNRPDSSENCDDGEIYATLHSESCLSSSRKLVLLVLSVSVVLMAVGGLVAVLMLQTSGDAEEEDYQVTEVRFSAFYYSYYVLKSLYFIHIIML